MARHAMLEARYECNMVNHAWTCDETSPTATRYGNTVCVSTTSAHRVLPFPRLATSSKLADSEPALIQCGRSAVVVRPRSSTGRIKATQAFQDQLALLAVEALSPEGDLPYESTEHGSMACIGK
jgi:hypothetical protein